MVVSYINHIVLLDILICINICSSHILVVEYNVCMQQHKMGKAPQNLT